MIKLTDLGGRERYVNQDLIERMDFGHDTLLLFVNGHSLVVKEKPEEILEKISRFKGRCLESAMTPPAPAPAEPIEPEPDKPPQ